MIHLSPPYRLETVEDVRSIMPPRPDENEQALLRFAKSSALKIVKPPIMAFLAPKTDIELREVKTSYRWVIADIDLTEKLRDARELIQREQDGFLEATKDLTNDYFLLFRRILEEGRGLVKVKKAINHHGGEGEGESPLAISGGLRNQSDAYELLVAVLRRYLHTRQKKYHDFLIINIRRLCAFIPGEIRLDEEMTARFHELPPTSSLILNDLHILYGERLERLKRNMFLPHARHFLNATKQKITGLVVSPSVKRNVIDVLNEVGCADDIKKARQRLERMLKLYEGRLDHEELLRLRNLLDNFYEKLASFESFFDKLCAAAKIRKLYAFFCKNLRIKKIDIESLSSRVIFTLYPCKDLHDYLKGRYSGDCTHAPELAAGHLLHRRFFNVRIFREEKWIGCIYMLDYTDRGVLILDRIQIGSKDAFVLINFFPSFIKQFTKATNYGNNFTLLAPAIISNFRIIQDNFKIYVKGLPKMPFTPGGEDRMFESACQKNFYVIGENS